MHRVIAFEVPKFPMQAAAQKR